jgi:ketosteroid isomerase-like protein
MPQDPSVGERFARALLAKDWPSVKQVVSSDVDFRGLTPGRPWEATTSEDLVENVFARWLEPADDVYEVLSVTTAEVQQRQRVVYRFRVRSGGKDYVCEQTAYFDEADGQIGKLRILCTGFMPTSEQLPEEDYEGAD